MLYSKLDATAYNTYRSCNLTEGHRTHRHKNNKYLIVRGTITIGFSRKWC